MALNTGRALGIAAYVMWSAAGPLNGATAQGRPSASAAPQGGDALLPGIPASKAPAGIAWGPGREVQAGVVLAGRYGRPDQHTGLYVFAVYLRNRSGRALTVTSRSYSGLSVPGDATDYSTLIQSEAIACTPHLVDSHGKPVDVQFKPGNDERRFSLGPGQVAEVSHWMLRTMPPDTRRQPNRPYTQVAFVQPGKYRLSCDVTAEWPGSRHSVLRTGPGAFEVTLEDLEGLHAGVQRSAAMPRQDEVRHNQMGPLDEAAVLAIARRAVAANDTWTGSAEFDKPTQEADGSGWSVLVWRLPRTPGGHRLIKIDTNGKVINYIRGH